MNFQKWELFSGSHGRLTKINIDTVDVQIFMCMGGSCVHGMAIHMNNHLVP